MTTTLDTPDEALGPESGADLDPKRFRALAIIAVAQLMVVLDASVVIIALPSAQRALHISTANRQWMLTAYTLSFAGLLLLGGRIADYFGRKRMFVISLVGFAAASALGGLAQNSAMLFSARALQGAFAAIMAPAALSLLTVAFTEPKERARAFAVYGGIAGGGAAIGLILGGFLTEFASWRWTLLINVPIAIVAAVAAFRYVTESRASSNHGLRHPRGGDRDRRPARPRLRLHQGRHRRLGLIGHRQPVRRSRRAPGGLRAHRAAVQHPLLPLRVVLDRNRGGSFLASLLVGTALLGTFLSLTYYFQGTLHYSALKSGFAFVPFSVGIITGATLASRLLPRFGPRLVMTGGLLLGMAGLVLFSTPRRALCVRDHRAPGRGDREPRHGPVVRRHEQHGPDRREPAGRRRGQCAGQRHAADRRHHGRGADQHDRHQRHGVLRGRPRKVGGRAHGRLHPRLHDGLHLQRHCAGGGRRDAFALIRRGRPDAADIVTGEEQALVLAPADRREPLRAGRTAPGAPARRGLLVDDLDGVLGAVGHGEPGLLLELGRHLVAR